MSYFLILPGEDGATVHILQGELNQDPEWWLETFGIKLNNSALNEQEVRQESDPNYWAHTLGLTSSTPFLLIKGAAVGAYEEEVVTRWRFT